MLSDTRLFIYAQQRLGRDNITRAEAIACLTPRQRRNWKSKIRRDEARKRRVRAAKRAASKARREEKLEGK